MKAGKAFTILSVFVGLVVGQYCQVQSDCPPGMRCNEYESLCYPVFRSGSLDGYPGMNNIDSTHGVGSFYDYCYTDDDCTAGKYCHTSGMCAPKLRSGPRRMVAHGCDRVCRPNWICDGFKCIPRLHQTMRCNSDYECESGICDYDSGRCA